MTLGFFPDTCEWTDTDKKGDWTCCSKPWAKITDELRVYCDIHYLRIVKLDEQYRKENNGCNRQPHKE